MNTIQAFPARPHQARGNVVTVQHRVLAEEVDAFHVVHFSKYLGWFSEALIAAFESRGLGPGRFDNDTVQIRMARVQVAYLKSARLDDLADIDITRVELRNNGLLLYVLVRVDKDVLARGRMTIACVAADSGELVRLPEEVRRAFVPSSFAEAA